MNRNLTEATNHLSNRNLTEATSYCCSMVVTNEYGPSNPSKITLGLRQWIRMLLR